MDPSRFANEDEAVDYVENMTHRIAHVHLALADISDAGWTRWTGVLSKLRFTGTLAFSGEIGEFARHARSAPDRPG